MTTWTPVQNNSHFHFKLSNILLHPLKSQRTQTKLSFSVNKLKEFRELRNLLNNPHALYELLPVVPSILYSQ